MTSLRIAHGTKVNISNLVVSYDINIRGISSVCTKSCSYRSSILETSLRMKRNLPNYAKLVHSSELLKQCRWSFVTIVARYNIVVYRKYQNLSNIVVCHWLLLLPGKISLFIRKSHVKYFTPEIFYHMFVVLTEVKFASLQRNDHEFHFFVFDTEIMFNNVFPPGAHFTNMV